MPANEMKYPPIPPDDYTRKLTFARPDRDGELTHIGLVGDTYTVTVFGKDTENRFCAIDMHVPPGGGPGPHRHNYEETFVVLEGEIEATFRGALSTVRVGETIVLVRAKPWLTGSDRRDRLLFLGGGVGFGGKVGQPVD